MWDRWNDDERNTFVDGIQLIIATILYLALLRLLPEWMANMILVGMAVLSYCIYRVM